MKRQVTRALAALSLALSVLVIAPPAADAGNGYWSRSICRASLDVYDRPWDNAVDFRYWPIWRSFPEYTTVHGRAHDIYWRHARECGWLDRPTNNGFWSYSDGLQSWVWFQYFVNGDIFFVERTGEWWSCRWGTNVPCNYEGR
jgi:hypothetical protein